MKRSRSRKQFHLRALFCVCSFIVAGIAMVGTISSSRAGGSTPPIEDSPWRKAMANLTEGANIKRQRQLRQRAEDNAFHLKIAPWVIEHTANGEHAEFIVVLVDQADLNGAAALTTKTENGRYV